MSISVKYCTDCEDPEEEACPFCANLYQKKGLGNHKIHCRQRPLASGPRNGASDAPRGVDTATGAGAPAPHAAHFERLEAILERMLEQRAPRSVQREEHRPHGHIDVAQLFRDERARNERNEEARQLASQQASQLAHEERKAAADRAHEVTLKLALESSKNMMSALKATAESHARRGRDKKRKKKKTNKKKSKQQKPNADPICLSKPQAQTRLILLQATIDVIRWSCSRRVRTQ